MLEKQTVPSLTEGRLKINNTYRLNELDSIRELMVHAALDEATQHNTSVLATTFVRTVRAERKKTTGIDSFLAEYS